MASYVLAVVSRAWRDTRARFRWNWMRILDAAGAGIAGIVALYAIKGAKATVDYVSITASGLAGMLAWFTLILVCNLAMAPRRIWLDDKNTIADLEKRLEPGLALSFDADTCKRWLRRGSVSESAGGNRYFAIDRREYTILVTVYNMASVPARTCKATIEQVDYNGKNLVVDPVTAIWMKGGDMEDIPPEVPRYIKLIIQPSEYDRPYLAAVDPIFDHNFIFSDTGEYTIHVMVYGENIAASRIGISLKLRVHNMADSQNKPFTTYEIADVKAVAGYTAE